MKLKVLLGLAILLTLSSEVYGQTRYMWGVSCLTLKSVISAFEQLQKTNMYSAPWCMYPPSPVPLPEEAKKISETALDWEKDKFWIAEYRETYLIVWELGKEL